MRTIHVYVPTSKPDRYRGLDPDGLFLISTTAASGEMSASEYLLLQKKKNLSGHRVFVLRAAHGEKGLGRLASCVLASPLGNFKKMQPSENESRS